MPPVHSSHHQEARSALTWVLPLLLLMASVIVLPAPHASRGLAAYLPLHNILEVMAIAVACMVFGVTWNTHRYQKNGRALVLGVCFLGVALLDLTHTLSYEGMPDFVTPSGPEKSIAFWLAARTLAAMGLLAIALTPHHLGPELNRISRPTVLAATLVLVALVHVLLLFYPHLLPRTFVPGSGLTAFKVGYEYTLIATYLGATWLLARHLRRERTFNTSGLMAAAATMAMSEFFFTLYANVTDVYNLMGHLYKIVAYGFLYRALFVETVQSPHQQLLQTQNQLRATLDTLPDLLFEVDGNGTYLDVHATDAGKLAAPAAALVGRNLRDVLPHEAVAQCLAAMEQAREHGISRGTRILLNVPDGQRYFELSVARRTPDADPATGGNAERFLVLSRDVTEVVRQEQQLQHEADLNAALLELESHHEVDDEPALLRFGVELAEKLTESRIAFIHFVNADQESIELVTWSSATLAHYCTAAYDRHYPISQAGIWAEAFRQRQPMVFNDYASAPHKKGLPKGHSHLERLVSLPVMEGEQVRMLVGVGNKPADYTPQDVAALQILANAIWNKVRRQRQEAHILRLSTAMAQNPYSVIITDARGNIEYVNQAFTDISGYTPEEVIGKNPKVFKSEQTPPETYQALWEHLARGQPWRGELINRRKDGSSYSELTLIYPVRDALGRVVNYLAHKEDITQRKEAEARIHQLAHYDQLTGLPNRASMEKRLGEELGQATADSPLTLLWLDLDSFKTINDSLGYEAGDLLLVEIANRLRQELDEGDCLARPTGDTFVAILPRTGHQTATVQARRMLDALQRPFKVNAHELSVSGSIGLAVCPHDGGTVAALLNRAETAMYSVKQEGRNGLRFFAPEMQANSERTLALLHALKQAQARNELHVAYQPQMALPGGGMVGAEALLRWRHPELGDVGPGEFIPLAERNGLIVPIGTWVLREVMRQIRAWRDAGLGGLSVAVNLSAVQFAQPGLVDDIRRMVDEAGIDAACLELELTEAVALQNPVAAGQTIHALQAAGFKISIDDFGTGYSSMSYLKRFAVDKLKIDQSFVREVQSSTDDQAIVTAIVQMAHGLGTITIAEGVETQAQLDFLRTCGCDQIQGYWYSRPLSPEAFEAFARRHQSPEAAPEPAP